MGYGSSEMLLKAFFVSNEPRAGLPLAMRSKAGSQAQKGIVPWQQATEIPSGCITPAR